MRNNLKIIFTDLDGSLLNDRKELSPGNLDCLHELGRINVIRVIATGRSLYSFDKLFTRPIPIDYLIFSSGAGIIDLATEELIQHHALCESDIKHIVSHLMDQRVDFMVHEEVPENHRFTYFSADGHNEDFQRRISLYREFATPFVTPDMLPRKSAQIIAILPNDMERFNTIKKGLAGYQVTRTTSPLDHTSIWMEIYPSHVSKGSSASWLCERLQVDHSATMGLGNDYNDLSLLHFTRHSYVVANAPLELREEFNLTLSNDEDGFCHAAKTTIDFEARKGESAT